MKAITYDRYGPPEVLHIQDVEAPTPRGDEVLIRVRAVEATKSDVEMRSFQFSVKWFSLPLRLVLGVRRPKRRILGGYFSGVVEAVGRKVTRLSPGDEVFGCAQLRLGAYAEYLALPAGYTIARKPGNMTFTEAAAVPLGGLNALHFMRLAAIRPGERVLINGAGGSIGAHAVQIARSMGADVTVVDKPIKEPMLRRLGASRFIDYTQTDFTRTGESYDVIFDMVPGSSYGGCMRSLNSGGRYLAGNARLSVFLRSVFTTRFTSKTARVALARETPGELTTLREMIEAGEVGTIVDRVYPMEEAAEAHRRVATEERLGAIVIEID